MQWITQKQAKKAATSSRRAAIINSLLHWKQLEQATATELNKKMSSLRFNGDIIKNIYCALCLRHKGDCVKCGLGKVKGECCKEWRDANNAFFDFAWLLTESQDNFTKAAGRMANKIEKLLLSNIKGNRNEMS